MTPAQKYDVYGALALELRALSLECCRSVHAPYDRRLFDALAGESGAINGTSTFVDGSGVVEFQGREPVVFGADRLPRRWSVTMGGTTQVEPESTELCGWGLMSDGYVVTFSVNCDGVDYEVLVFGEDDSEVRIAGDQGSRFAHVAHLERWVRSHDVDAFRRYLRDAQRSMHDGRQ